MSEENKRDEEESRERQPAEEQSLLRSDAAVAAYRKQAEDAGGAQPSSTPEEPAADEQSEELAELKDLLQRKVADFDNYRKRVQREREEIAARAAEGLIEELLPVLDHLELALAAEGESAADYRKGVEMILQQLRDLLGRHGLEPIEALGRHFDPHVHEAVISEATSEHPEGSVIAELQRGYKLKGKVLRPAKVKVAALPEDEGDGDDGPREIPIR
jgi:molecular chaperone GrpE